MFSLVAVFVKVSLSSLSLEASADPDAEAVIVGLLLFVTVYFCLSFNGQTLV